MNPYPDWSGQWARIGSLNWEPEGYEKAGPPPLTAEYQAIREQYLAQREQGILAGDPPATCLPPGMPRVMTMSFPMEIIVTPKITYIYADWESQVRRVYTDGRDLARVHPARVQRLLDRPVARRERRRRLRHAVDRDARHERPALVRLGGRRAARQQSNGRARRNSAHRREHARGSHHDDRRRAHRARGPCNRRYRLEQDNPVWVEYVCAEGNRHIKLGDEWYFVNDETGTLDPTRVGQPRLVPEAH